MSILEIYLIGCAISTFISLLVPYLDWRDGHNIYLSDFFQYTVLAVGSWISIIYFILGTITELIDRHVCIVVIKGKDY